MRLWIDVVSGDEKAAHLESIARRELIARAGSRKILFDSDGSWLHPGVELEKVRLLGLSPGDESLVCAGNLLRLLGRGRARRHVKPAPTRGAAEAELPARGPWARRPE